jgi:hypothetical protein
VTIRLIFQLLPLPVMGHLPRQLRRPVAIDSPRIKHRNGLDAVHLGVVGPFHEGVAGRDVAGHAVGLRVMVDVAHVIA